MHQRWQARVHVCMQRMHQGRRERTPADHGDLLALEQRGGAVADGARGDAAAPELGLARHAQAPRRGAGSEDDGVRPQRHLIALHHKRPHRRVDAHHVLRQQLRAPPLRLHGAERVSGARAALATAFRAALRLQMLPRAGASGWSLERSPAAPGSCTGLATYAAALCSWRKCCRPWENSLAQSVQRWPACHSLTRTVRSSHPELFHTLSVAGRNLGDACGGAFARLLAWCLWVGHNGTLRIIGRGS